MAGKPKHVPETTKHLNRFKYTQDQAIEKPFNWSQLVRLLKYVKPYWKTLLPISIIAMLIATIVRLIVPILIGKVAIDGAIADGDTNLLIQLVVGVAIMYLISYIANMLRIKYVNILGQNVIYDLRQHLFSHVQRLSHKFFDTRSAGSILVRIMNDINSLQELFTNGIINLLMDVVMLTGIIVILFALSPKLALAILVIMPIMFYISTKLRRNIRKSWQQVRIQQSRLNSHLNESLQGVRITQSFSQERENAEYFDGVNTNNFESWNVATRKSAMFRPFVEMSNAVGTVILVAYGAFLILQEGLPVGTFVSFAFFSWYVLGANLQVRANV